MATLIRTDGSRESLDVDARGLSAQQLVALIGGHVEILVLGRFPPNEDGVRVLVFDEEGKLRDKPINWAATEIARAASRAGMLHFPAGDVLVGDVVEAIVYDAGLDSERFL